MKLLLDTHAFLWFVTDSDSLSEKAKNVIEDVESEVYLRRQKPSKSPSLAEMKYLIVRLW